MFQRFFKLTTLVTSVMLFGDIQASHAQISVKVNNNMVNFDRVGPKEIGGSVFIPLRTVSESLGVDIHWEEATQTVTGKKGPHAFVLRVDSREANVDGQAVTLSSPARIMYGVTMVPLRFVAEALGAEVHWRPELSMVTITSEGTPPISPPVHNVSIVSGEVVDIQSRGNSPSLTVRTSNGRTRFDVTRDTVISRGRSGERGSALALDQVVLGNTVEIKPDSSGSVALSVKELMGAASSSRHVMGEIISIQPRTDPPTINISTPNGRSRYEITPDTVILSGPVGSPGIQTNLNRLGLGNRVDIRTDRTGSRALTIRENR
ncbi:MAG: copper amine oxidase N-terminal domain-containing protein [Chthonomonadales bacterium]